MSLPQSIICLQKLIQTAFGYTMYELQDEKCYLELVNLLKKVRFNNAKISLLVLIFETLFLENDKFKALENESIKNDFIKLCEIKSCPKDVEKETHFQIIQQLLKYKLINEVELYLIYFLTKNNQSHLLFFKAIEAVVYAKDKYCICNPKIKIDINNVNYYNFLLNVINFFDTFRINDSDKYYMFSFEKKTIIKKVVSNKEISEYVNKEEIERTFIVNFLKKNTKKTPIISKSNQMAANTRSAGNHKEDDLQNQLNILKKQIKELREENNKLKYYKDSSQIKISEQEKKLGEQENKLYEQSKKLSEQENRISSLIIENSKKLSRDFNLKIEKLNKSYAQKIFSLQEQINKIKQRNNTLSLKNEKSENEKNKLAQKLFLITNDSKNRIGALEKELNENKKIKEDTTKKLDLVKIRDTAKCIVDFLYCILFMNVDLSINYEAKVQKICKELKKLKCDKTEFVDSLINFLNEVKTKKYEGDHLAHNGYRNDFLKDYRKVWIFLENYLEVGKYFRDFSNLYIAKNRNEDVKSKINYIKEMVRYIDFNSQLKSFKI